MAAALSPNVVFVLGGPGAGKGTMCALAQNQLGWEHLSAGDLLRAERNNPDSKNGELINNYIKEGKIVPVEITVGLLGDAMQKSGKSKFLIDGFPRNPDNLEARPRAGTPPCTAPRSGTRRTLRPSARRRGLSCPGT